MSEFLAKYCCVILEENINLERINNLINIFKIIGDKDVFMKNYERVIKNK